MSVLVNGRMHDLPEPPTLAALLVALAPPLPFAVACNGEFVQRGTYEDCRIDRGDRIDIVHPTAGG
ncbi:MAG: sulfur carrier protein ThiS [Candidatus Sulfotelmatobacter sp.]|jgi:sulfur carrier protein